MDTRTGEIYPSLKEALEGGAKAEDLVEVNGSEKAIRRLKRKVRMASKFEAERRKKRSAIQNRSRRANR